MNYKRRDFTKILCSIPIIQIPLPNIYLPSKEINSISITTNFNLEQLFESGLHSYDDIEVSIYWILEIIYKDESKRSFYTKNLKIDNSNNTEKINIEFYNNDILINYLDYFITLKNAKEI